MRIQKPYIHYSTPTLAIQQLLCSNKEFPQDHLVKDSGFHDPRKQQDDLAKWTVAHLSPLNLNFACRKRTAGVQEYQM